MPLNNPDGRNQHTGKYSEPSSQPKVAQVTDQVEALQSQTMMN